MRHRLYYHITWTTREREPLISVGLAEFLSRFLPAIVRQERGRVIALGMVSSHLHLLVRLHPTSDIPRLLQRMKGGSANVAQREGHNGIGAELRWAKGYNIESVGPRQIPVVMEYVFHQPEHHPEEAIPGWKSANFEMEEPVAISDLSAEPRLSRDRHGGAYRGVSRLKAAARPIGRRGRRCNEIAERDSALLCSPSAPSPDC